MKTSGNTILVTGGGTGIGRALAHAWHDAGNVVIVTGRTLASLEETVAGREGLHAMVLDVTDPAAIAAFAAQVVARFPALNVLVNNAGIMRYEEIGTARDLGDAQAMITTNLLGPIRMTDALVDHLAGQADAAIVNVSSGLAFVPLVIAPTYNATKAALHSYTQSLRVALAGKVEVIELAPPACRPTSRRGRPRARAICRWPPISPRRWTCSRKCPRLPKSACPTPCSCAMPSARGVMSRPLPRSIDFEAIGFEDWVFPPCPLFVRARQDPPSMEPLT
jgi:uncharacterized oxidoreductase